jgi:DNA-binding transcriptional MerR regulator
MPVGRAAELLGVSTSHLHSFDEQLKPARDRFQRRWYRPADVERVAAARAAKSTR